MLFQQPKRNRSESQESMKNNSCFRPPQRETIGLVFPKNHKLASNNRRPRTTNSLRCVQEIIVNVLRMHKCTRTPAPHRNLECNHGLLRSPLRLCCLVGLARAPTIFDFFEGRGRSRDCFTLWRGTPQW
mmetsp:Transcript_19686/g.54973  ORF Transcript_19686/g.54973 Transcript_19686/m.54973 type:complete len:129 (+) Transcript_19686:118-504(+)